MRVVNVLDALGTDLVIVETVGVGQEEVDVVRVADTVCLVTVPGLGDDIQAIKAGVLEIADVLVVNKADKPGADEAARDLAQMLSLGPSVRPGPASPAPGEPHSRWKPPIVRTSAQDGSGVEELVRSIDAHAEWSRTSGELEERRAGAARQEVEALLRDALVQRLESRIGSQRVTDAVKRVATRELDPYRAVEELLRE
jgi:LAO/AO transport system kinase